MIQGIALIHTLAQIESMIEAGEISGDSRWFALPESGSVAGATRRYTKAREVTHLEGNAVRIERETLETCPDTIERDSAEKFRDAVPAACRAIGVQVAPNQPFLIPGDALPRLVSKIKGIRANASDFNAGATFYHATIADPIFIPVDPASLAGHVNRILTDKLATIRRVIRGGVLPAARGTDGYGAANIASIFSSSAYKGADKLAPTPAIADQIRAAIVEAKTLADAIWAYAEPKGGTPRSADDVRAFAAGLETRCIDSTIGQIAPPGHPIWAEIMPAPSSDPAAALADGSAGETLDDGVMEGLV